MGHAAGASLAAEARLLDEMATAVGRIFDTLLAGEVGTVRLGPYSRAHNGMRGSKLACYCCHSVLSCSPRDLLVDCLRCPAALDAKAMAAYKSRALAALHQMNNLVGAARLARTSRMLRVCLACTTP